MQPAQGDPAHMRIPATSQKGQEKVWCGPLQGTNEDQNNQCLSDTCTLSVHVWTQPGPRLSLELSLWLSPCWGVPKKGQSD